MSDESPPDEPREPPTLRIVKSRRGVTFSAEMYEALVAAYLELKPRSARGLARATGCSQDTALKAINIGWPSRQWAPLRERAKLHDAALAARTNQQAAKTTVEALDEQLHLATRIETFRMMQGLRALAMNVSKRLQDQLARATCDRQGKRTRVIEERRGRRVVQRVVQEDVTLQPYLPDVASAIREMAAVVFGAAGAEQRVFVAKVPIDGRKVGGMDLTDEQLAYIRENGGKLPPGVTREMLGW